MSPAASCPGVTLPATVLPTIGVPLYKLMSDRQIADARVRTNTSPAPGEGIGRWTTSTLRSPGSETACMETPSDLI
jgi:hypothetical protein